MAEPKMEEVGRVVGFFAHVSVAIVELAAALKVGDTIYIKGHTTDVQQQVDSLQVDHVSVQEARSGQSAGLKVTGRCRKHDVVYKLVA
jgi:putative protease